MNKQEFLGNLRNALSGRIAVPQVEDTINYYEDYINVEMRKGKSEEEVLKSLGDPRLIARTIIQTNGTADNLYDTTNGSYRESRYQDSSYQGEQYQDAYNGYRGTRRSFRIPGWLMAIIIILIVFFVISIIFSVLSFLAPVLIVIAAVLFLVKLFRDWLN